MKIARGNPSWVPANEIRGEGIFFQFSETEIQHWLGRVQRLNLEFFSAHNQWRKDRGLQPPEDFYPGLRYVLLHSFAHALIRQLSLECGYTAASLRERIYSRNPSTDRPEMAGVLIYTAAPDSEGTLGGLVSLGEPGILERHLNQAMDSMRLCSSDPLFAEHHPGKEGTSLHGASCHACLFARDILRTRQQVSGSHRTGPHRGPGRIRILPRLGVGCCRGFWVLIGPCHEPIPEDHRSRPEARREGA